MACPLVRSALAINPWDDFHEVCRKDLRDDPWLIMCLDSSENQLMSAAALSAI